MGSIVWPVVRAGERLIFSLLHLYLICSRLHLYLICSASLASEVCVDSHLALVQHILRWCVQKIMCIRFLLLGDWRVGLRFLLLKMRIFFGLCDRCVFLVSTIVSSDGKILMRYSWEGRHLSFWAAASVSTHRRSVFGTLPLIVLSGRRRRRRRLTQVRRRRSRWTRTVVVVVMGWASSR